MAVTKALTALVGRLCVWRKNGPERGFRLFRLNLKYLYCKQNGVDPGQTPRSVASDLGLLFASVLVHEPSPVFTITKPFHATLPTSQEEKRCSK